MDGGKIRRKSLEYNILCLVFELHPLAFIGSSVRCLHERDDNLLNFLLISLHQILRMCQQFLHVVGKLRSFHLYGILIGIDFGLHRPFICYQYDLGCLQLLYLLEESVFDCFAAATFLHQLFDRLRYFSIL